MATYASDILFSIDTALQLKGGCNSETIAVARTLTYKDSTFQRLSNGSGGSLECFLPEFKTGAFFVIRSIGANAISVKMASGTVVCTLATNVSAVVACDGTEWYLMVQGT